MNRGIDYRTDFYSLGVTFYELLTGELPFTASEPMELVHCHIAKTAPLVHEINPEIPSVLSKIVSKLMAKNAEDRYQSALGLKCDLEKCLHQLKIGDKITSFEIAQKDICDRFIIPDKLYGREAEVSTLLQAFERTSLGATEMMLVAGFSGIGKTAVVNEVHKPEESNCEQNFEAIQANPNRITITTSLANHLVKIAILDNVDTPPFIKRGILASRGFQ